MSASPPPCSCSEAFRAVRRTNGLDGHEVGCLRIAWRPEPVDPSPPRWMTVDIGDPLVPVSPCIRIVYDSARDGATSRLASPADVALAAAERAAQRYCHFCRKPRREVKAFVESETGARICDECVGLAVVTHAPDVTGEAALCGRPTSPDKILASGPVDAVGCPACVERINTDAGFNDACAGAAKARQRLAEAMRLSRST